MASQPTPPLTNPPRNKLWEKGSKHLFWYSTWSWALYPSENLLKKLKNTCSFLAKHYFREPSIEYKFFIKPGNHPVQPTRKTQQTQRRKSGLARDVGLEVKWPTNTRHDRSFRIIFGNEKTRQRTFCVGKVSYSQLPSSRSNSDDFCWLINGIISPVPRQKHKVEMKQTILFSH